MAPSPDPSPAGGPAPPPPGREGPGASDTLRARVAALEHENRDLEHLFDASGLAMVFLDDALRLVRFTSEFGARFGVAPENRGASLSDVGAAVPYDGFAEDARGVLTSGEGIEREVELEDGTRYFARVLPYGVGEGRAGGVAATFTDVTRRREAEATASRREERFRRVIEEAPIPVFLHDEDGRILQISRAVTALTGYTADEIPTREAWAERAYGPDRVRPLAPTERLFRFGEPVEGLELVVRTKAGEQRVWQASSALLGDDRRGRKLAVSMAADVTERKRAEADREARARQQHVVAELGLEALRSGDLQALFEGAVLAVQDTLGTDAATVLALEGDRFRLRAAVGWPDDLEQPVTAPNDERSQAGYTLTVAHPVIVEDAAAEARFERYGLLERYGLESGMSVVIGGPEHPFGVLGTHARAPRPYSEADADFLQAVANVLGSAVERDEAQRGLRAANERLEQRVEERTASLRTSEARLRTLYEVIARPAPTFADQLDAALEAATGLLGLDAGILSRIEGDTYTIEACFAPGSALEPGQTFAVRQTCCAITIAANGPLSIEHLSASEHQRHPCASVFAVESYIGAPVLVDGTLYGTLNFSGTAPRPEPFPEADREFVSLLAQWIGVAVARDRAGRQLAESERLLAGVLLGSQDGIVALRALRNDEGAIEDFSWLLVNPAAAELLGRPAAKLIGASYLETFPTTRSLGVFDALADVADGGEPFQREIRYVADGISGWFAFSAVPLGDGVAATFRDITDRKRTEEALRESEARFRELFEGSPDAIFVEDLAGVVLDVNPAACRLHRADRAWLVGRSVAELVPEESRERVLEDFARLTAGQTAPLESYSLTRDGAAVPVEVRTDRITYAGQEALLLHVRDITARREAERALAESEERFAKAFHASPAAVLIATLDEGRFVDVNESFCRLTGFTRTEVIGRPYDGLDLIGPAVGPGLGLRQLREAGEVRELELQVRSRTGAVRDVVLSAERVELGGVPCVLGIGFDVTERKRLEREVIQATELERRRIGQDLHDELGQQLTGAAFLGKVLQQKLEARAVPEASDAAQLLDLISAALSETRDFSRLLSPVDIQAEGLMDALQDLADQTERVFDVSCTLETEGDVRVQDNAAATHLFRIAQEAVNNALKHARPSTIALCLRRTPAGLLLTVDDDGTGFDPRRPRSRSGLGLRTMQYRAALVGAQLTVVPGAQGTRVAVSLPWGGPSPAP